MIDRSPIARDRNQRSCVLVEFAVGGIRLVEGDTSLVYPAVRTVETRGE
jgi:hypothetical protein